MSIKTEIEWFSPKEKLPEFDKPIMIKNCNNIFYGGNFKNFSIEDGDDFCFYLAEIGYVPTYNIKYWAYLPEFEE